MGGQLWEVVGGGDKGGILVRAGVDTASALEPQRLSTGALVRELALEGDRLHYESVDGDGPPTGWVSIALKGNGKPLMARSSRAEPAPASPFVFEAARSRISFETPAMQKVPEEVKATLSTFDQSKLGEVFANIGSNEPGVHFKMHFPHTPQQVAEFGPDWLTTAFRMAGTLPEDNSVKRIVSMREATGGGAAVKAIMTVEYEKPSDELHTELFLKLPLDPSHKNRFFCITLAMEGGELLFNRFIIRCLPIRTPKYYFGDLNMKTTNWILISEKLPFADKSTRGQRLRPFEMEAPVLKGMDWSLPDKAEKYYALWRTNAIMAAWGHSGKLGDLTKLYAKPDTSRNVLFPQPEKIFSPFWKQTEDLVLNVAPGLFAKDISDSSYMAQLEKEAKEVSANIHRCNERLKKISTDFWGLVHMNSHIDNAFFWVDEEGRVDAGLLDFGGLGLSLLAPSLAGNMACADAEVRAGHMEGLARCFVDTLHEFGGPLLNSSDLYFNIALVDMKSILGSMTVVESGGFGGIYEHRPKDQWTPDMTLRDPIFELEDVATMMLRTTIVTLVEGLRTWKLAGYYEKFVRWRGQFGSQPKK